MYQDFYELRKPPFQLLPDPDFFYRSHKHDTALTHLEYGISQRAGFIVITGEIGTGKTTLLRHMLRFLDEEMPVALISQTLLHAEELLQAVCQEFSLPYLNKGKPELQELFGIFLVEQYRIGKYVILILDEAQNLPLETLEEIRMLSNLDADNECILQIILIGQPALRAKLQSAELRQLYQRVEVSYHLAPLDRQELKEYIRYRIKTAGGKNNDLFDDKAIETIYEYSGGVPRLINAICHSCLVYGYADGKKKIHRNLVETVLNDRAKCGLFPPSETFENQEKPSTPSSEQKMNQKAISANDELNNKLDHLIEISGLSTGAFERFATNWADIPNQTIVTDLKERLGNERKTSEVIENRLSQVETLLSQVNTDTSRIDYQKQRPAEPDDEPKSPLRRAANPIVENHKQPFGKGLSNLNGSAILSFLEGRIHFVIMTVLFMICVLFVVWAGGGLRENDNSNKGRPESDSRKSAISGETGALPENKDTKPGTNITADGSGRANLIHLTDAYSLVEAELERKNFDKAIELLDLSDSYESYDPKISSKLYALALTGQAKGLLADNHLKQAETTLLKAVEVNPDNFETHFELGKLYTKTKEYPNAINSYQNATDLNPEMASAFYNLGFVFAKSGNYASAEEALLRAAELSPPYADKVLFNLAVVQLKLGKKEFGIQNLQKSLALNPSNRRAEAFLEKVLNNP